MNTRRIPIALLLLVGVCAALAYLIGSYRPFAPSAKFSNIPLLVTAPRINAAIALISPTTAATEQPTVSPSSTRSSTALGVSPPSSSQTPTRVVKTNTRQAPANTPTRIPVKVSQKPVFPTFTPLPNLSTRIPVKVSQKPVFPTFTPRATLSARVTRRAQATEPPTGTVVPDAFIAAATQTRVPAPQNSTAAARQTSVFAQQTMSALSTRSFSTPVLPGEAPARAINNTTNFLLIGTDSRTDDPTWVPNTDVLMVLFLDTANQRAALLSLPRDLLVAIPGQPAFRINSAYHHGWATEGVEGGINVLVQILRNDFEIRIDHWALIDFDGLSNIIDALGGIQVNVPCALSDTIDQRPFTIPAGLVQMDYLTAKRYVQSRYTTSDTSRNHRQQRVLWAMAKKALDLNAADRVPLMYEQLRQNVATDMTLFSMLGLIPAVYRLDLQNHPERLRAKVLEAPAVYPWVSTSGAWLYLPNYELIRQELDEIFQSPQVASNEVTRAECPVVPATPQPTDVPSVTPTIETESSAGLTVTPVVEGTPTGAPTETPLAVPTEMPTAEVTPVEAPSETPAAEWTPTEMPTAEVTPALQETATDVPTEPSANDETPSSPQTPSIVLTETPTS